jgi:hypothetical protein
VDKHEKDLKTNGEAMAKLKTGHEDLTKKHGELAKNHEKLQKDMKTGFDIVDNNME